jgi:hypothetical protein
MIIERRIAQRTRELFGAGVIEKQSEWRKSDKRILSLAVRIRSSEARPKGDFCMRDRVVLATLVAWVLLVVAIGYWRMFYAWRLGSTFQFFFHYMPILIAALVVVLLVEGLFLRRGR